MTKSNVHLIADETLGGVKREFIEVERKAEVGDMLWLVNVEMAMNTDDTGFSIGEINDDIAGGSVKTLEPTDIIVIDGTRYHLVERIARVGEKVIYTAPGSEIGVNNGDIVLVHNAYTDGYVCFKSGAISPKNYLVLVPVEASVEESIVTVDSSQCSEAVLDMFANLACRVTELEKLAGMQRNENRLAHDRIEEVNEKAEMCIRDIAMLDERLIEIETPTQTPIESETTQPHIFDLAKIKAFKLSDLDGKELRIHSASDSEGGITVTTTVAVDVNDGKMYVLESEVVEPKQAAEALLRKIAKLIEEEGGGI